MADCGTYSHQMIAYRGLFDLKDAQVLRAEIVSIDTEANTAEVTLLDTCEGASWINIETVPFFYHCEDSTGTVEDLARGHLAFTVGDMVYLLAAKEKGEFPAQTYIIGHVDIRNTKTCMLTEFVRITFNVVVDSTTYTVITLFDTGAGSTVDPVAFTPLDELSPDPPPAFPCIKTTDVDNWLSYNFEYQTATVAVPCTVTATTASITNFVDGPPTNQTVSYTGTYGLENCGSVTIGNGQRISITEYDDYAEKVDLSGYIYGSRRVVTTNFSNAGIYTSGTQCGVYAGSAERSSEFYYDFDQDQEIGPWSINVSGVVGFTFTPFKIPIRRIKQHSRSVTMNCDGSSATATFDIAFEDRYTIDFEAIGGDSVVHSFASHCTSVFDMSSAPGTGVAVSALTPTSGTCDNDAWDVPSYVVTSVSGDGNEQNLRLWSRMENETASIKSGEVGVYVFWGAVGLSEWNVTGGTNPYRLNVYSDYVWGADVEVNETVSTTELRLSFRPFSTCTLISGTFTPLSNVHIKDCLSYADPVRSQGLNNTISSIVEYIQNDFIPSLGLTAYERDSLVYDLFTGSLREGPTVQILKKKTPA